MSSLPGHRRGRGAASNRVGRFEAWEREAEDDGWDTLETLQEGPETVFIRDTSRSILAHNQSPDVPFDRSINPYRGCEHGCVYCFARPSHAYLGLSPGLDFETRILFKPDAAALLRQELARPGYRCATIALGANTDPYQPVERRLGITRDVLEVLGECRHPVGIITKSALIERDLDLLADMARNHLVQVSVSVTTLDRELARRMEPRAAAPHRRLQTIRRLSEAGVPVTALVAPIIPALNDVELETVLAEAHGAGARSASYVLLRLPLEIKDLFQEWLDTHYPLKAGRVMNRVRDTRDGRLYDPTFGKRMRGSGEYAELIAKRFRLASRRQGYGEPPALTTAHFRPPSAPSSQLDLF
jgi:DNA repair photolyase